MVHPTSKLDSGAPMERPASESFDWEKFHRDLDNALADWLTTVPLASIDAPVISFIEFSNRCRQRQMKRPSAPTTTKGEQQ